MTLTRGGVSLAALILFVLLITPTGGATLFIVLSCLIGILLVNVPYAFASVRKLSIQRSHPSHVKEGSLVRVTLRITNKSRASRILLTFQDDGPPRLGDDPVGLPILHGGTTGTVTYDCKSGRRGLYTFRKCRTESSSPFGLVSSRKDYRTISELIVYPLYYELTGATFPFRRSHTGITAAPASRPGEGPNFFGLREYREGDPIKKIHWPSTARTQKVMVKEFEQDMHSSIALLLDTFGGSVTTQGEDSNMEVAIRAAASLANYSLTNGHPTTLSYYDDASMSIRTDKATGNLTPILDGLARLNTSRTQALDFLHGCEGAMRSTRNCIVILLSANEDILTELIRIRAQGLEVMAILVDGHAEKASCAAQPWFSQMHDALNHAGVAFLTMTIDDDVQAVLSDCLRQPVSLRI